MECADGIGAARMRQGLAAYYKQRIICNISEILVNGSKQSHKVGSWPASTCN